MNTLKLQIMKGLVRIATKEDAAQIFELRLKEYKANTKDFEIKRPEHLNWNEIDDKGIVIGAWSAEKKLLATMMAIVVKNKIEAENILEHNTPETISYPALILRRAATEHECHHLGLNTLLRYHFFKNLSQSKVENVLGQVYKGAPRTHTLLELGYSAIKSDDVEDSDLKYKTELDLVTLPKSSFESALVKLHDLNKGVVDDFPYVGKEIKY